MEPILTTTYTKEEAYQCAVLASKAYENFKDGQQISDSHIVLHTIVGHDTDTTLYLIHNTISNTLYISWRGTESMRDWLSDAAISKVNAFDIVGLNVHSGFYGCYKEVRTRLLASIRQYIENLNPKTIIVTGHSLGAALATLNAFDISITFKDVKNLQVYTFGSPRVGNKFFRTAYNSLVPNTFRFIHAMDIVTRVPKVGFNHVKGMGIHINSNGKIFKWYENLLSRILWYPKVLIADLTGEAIKDHMMKDYISSISKIK